METAYIVKGHIVNHTTIQLSESIPIDDNEVTVIIETVKKTAKNRDQGLLKGKIWMSPDLDEPLVDNIKSLISFYGSIPDFPDRVSQGIFEKRELL